MSLPFDLNPLLIALPVFALVLVFLTRSGKKPAPSSYPYTASSSLLTAHERRFLGALEEAASDYRIFAKVRLADVIGVQRGLTKSEWQRAFNAISQKHLDFVLCHPHDLSVFCAIELDDKSHERAERKARDAFLERALAAASVPLVRVPGKVHYDARELRTRLGELRFERAA